MGRLRVLRIVLQNIFWYYIVVEFLMMNVEKTEIEGARLLGY